jgi:ABC-type branched-subunit amino acid transport system substrate-binding protein
MMSIWPTWNAVVSARQAALALLAALILLTGCASTDPVVKIGLVAPFEGRHRTIGYDAIYSARLAVREINAAGGIGGHRVALVALDDRGDPELARQSAAALAIDPAVVVVLGHFLPETTEAVGSLYSTNDLPLIRLGEPPFGANDPTGLPAALRDAYAAVTPFDEEPGPFAGATYDAFGLLAQALAVAKEQSGEITRASVQEALPGLEYEGATGNVYWP